MKSCEFLSRNTCRAFKSRMANRVEMATHIPKLCVTDVSFGGNEFDPTTRVDGRCLAAKNIEDQQQCDDFKEKSDLVIKNLGNDWRNNPDIPHNCKPGALY